MGNLIRYGAIQFDYMGGHFNISRDYVEVQIHIDMTAHNPGLERILI